MSRCRVCGETYKAEQKRTAGMKVYCGSESCLDLIIKESIEKGNKKRERDRENKAKAERKKHREAKAALNNTIKYWRPKAQAMFNKFIRLRDKDLPCVSCGKTWNKDLITGSGWDAGHYRSTGACPQLRFEELNCHKQCVYCNRNQSGNHIEYRIRLVQRIGKDKVEWLEGPHKLPKMLVDDYKRVYEEYRLKIKEFEG
jgi:hypothetical protein